MLSYVSIDYHGLYGLSHKLFSNLHMPMGKTKEHSRQPG